LVLSANSAENKPNSDVKIYVRYQSSLRLNVRLYFEILHRAQQPTGHQSVEPSDKTRKRKLEACDYVEYAELVQNQV